MSKTFAIHRGRELGLGFLYWMTFLIALDPGDALSGADTARIVGASCLGALSAPLVLELIRRFPLEAGVRMSRHLAVHGGAAVAIAFGLIALSCFLAPLLQVGDTRPFLTALPSQLSANWLLLAFCVLAFDGLVQAARSSPRYHVEAVAALPPPSAFLTTVISKASGRSFEVSLSDVDWIETQGNYLALHVGANTYLIRETLVAFEVKLDPRAFVRIHRRVLVAIDRMREIEPLGNGDAIIHLRNGVSLRMSRSHGPKMLAARPELARLTATGFTPP